MRLEPPDEVDDTTVWFVDGRRLYFQIKSSLSMGTPEWRKVWLHFHAQLQQSDFTEEYGLGLVVGENTSLARDLRECTERAISAENDDEYHARLTTKQKKIVRAITEALGVEPDGQTPSLLAKLSVEIFPSATLGRDVAPLWMPACSKPPDVVLTLLRDVCSTSAAQRLTYTAPDLAEELRERFGLILTEPEEWGASEYRRTIIDRAVVTIPGVNFSKQIDAEFPWPTCEPFDRDRQTDFDDESPLYITAPRTNVVDLQQFPNAGLNRVVLIGGAGLGKTVLTKAIAGNLAHDGKLPAVIAVPELVEKDLGLLDYLSGPLNNDFHVHIDWARASEVGKLVLILDGFDEVDPESRRTALGRVNLFTGRFPDVPWLLTVRDATAVSFPAGAEFVEVSQLDSSSISLFISFYRPDVDEDFTYGFEHQLEGRPDLARLVRIPLFLALLLVTPNGRDGTPASRTDLLEDYLQILLRPDAYKPSGPKHHDSAVLRSFLERIAFDALERDHTGVDLRRLQVVAKKNHPGIPSDELLSNLTQCGMLRAVSPTRYVFPFPVIQEYLAGCHIATERSAEILGRIAKVAKRPWAQAIQFALERHDSPDDISRTILEQEDDAFFTKLRLLARSVSSGMACSIPLRIEIASRLARIWAPYGWRMAQRVGDMLADAFFEPLISGVREQLANRYLLYSGAGRIVANVDDPELTLEVLEGLLNSSPDRFLNISDLQPAVNKVAKQAFELYIRYARSSATSDTDHHDVDDATACLVAHLDTSAVPDGTIKFVANDSTVPIATRLACHLKLDQPLDRDVLRLVSRALAADGFEPRQSAVTLLLKRGDPNDLLISFLRSTDQTREARENILDSVAHNGNLDFLGRISADHEIAETLQLRATVTLARHGDAAQMAKLVTNIPENPPEIVVGTLAIFGHYPSFELAKSAMVGLSSRDWTDNDKRLIASSLRTGMTTIFMMDWFQTGTLEYCRPHPGIRLFEGILERWAIKTDFETSVDRLSYDLCLSELGYEEASNRLMDNVVAVVHDTTADLRDMTKALEVGHAIAALTQRRIFLEPSDLHSLIQRSSYNARSAAYRMLARIGTTEALHILISTYNERNIDATAEALTSIEELAGRLGVIVVRGDDQLICEDLRLN